MFEGGEEEADKGKEEGGAEEAPAAEASAGSKVANMADGDYLCHVLIEKGKNIFLDGDDTVDPMVKVIFNFKEKVTSAKNNITRSTQVKWDEHLFIESGVLKQKEIEEAVITFQIQNKGFFKSETIGTFSVSAKTIYQMKDHVVHNQPVSFTNPDAEDKAKITADLSISINI